MSTTLCAFMQVLLGKLVKRCPHAQATGWLLDVVRRRISRAVNGLAARIRDKGDEPQPNEVLGSGSGQG